MRRPPVIYQPDPLPARPEPTLGAAGIILAGHVHRAHRVTGIGWRLDCSGRTLRYSRVRGPLADFDPVRLPNIACKQCFA